MNFEQIKKLVPELGDIPLFVHNTADMAVDAYHRGSNEATINACLNGAGAGWLMGPDGVPVIGIQLDSLLTEKLTKEELRGVLLHEIGHIKCGHIPALEEVLAGKNCNGTFEETEQEADMFSLEHGTDIVDLTNGLKKLFMCQLTQTMVTIKTIKGKDASPGWARRYIRAGVVGHKVRIRAFKALCNQF